MSFFFGIPFYLQTVQVHLANCVMMQWVAREPEVLGENLPSLFTTNPRWPDPDSNWGRRNEKPAINRLSYDRVESGYYLKLFSFPLCYLRYRVQRRSLYVVRYTIISWSEVGNRDQVKDFFMQAFLVSHSSEQRTYFPLQVYIFIDVGLINYFVSGLYMFGHRCNCW
jgi:hypothetical protein